VIIWVLLGRGNHFISFGLFYRAVAIRKQRANKRLKRATVLGGG
jgi:hypothetical protein